MDPPSKKRKRSDSVSSSSSGSSSSDSENEKSESKDNGESTFIVVPHIIQVLSKLIILCFCFSGGEENEKMEDENDEESKSETKAKKEEVTPPESKKASDIEPQAVIDLASEDKEKEPRALHKTSSIFLRNLAPTITKAEVEAVRTWKMFILLEKKKNIHIL